MRKNAWVLLTLVAWGACAYRPVRPALPDERPKPNVRGRDIRVVDLGVPSETEPSPTIVPRRPLDLVMDDCEGFRWFNGAKTLIDREVGLLVEGWTDPGADNRNRTLTIEAFSPSCRDHAHVTRHFFYHDGPFANVRGRDIKLVRYDEHGFPEVLPRHPLHLVVEDCDGMAEFTTNDDSIDTWGGVLTLHWSDPAVAAIDEGRSLTILMFSPACRRKFPDDRFPVPTRSR